MGSPDYDQYSDGFGDWDAEIEREMKQGVDTPELEFEDDGKKHDHIKYLAAYAFGAALSATGVYVLKRKKNKE